MIARSLDLAAVPFKETRYRGVWIHFFRYDRDTEHAAVLIKMAPGCSYPPHRHRGPEELFILQGGYRDQHGEYGAGEYVRYEAGSAHHPVAAAGSDCVFFAIAAEGIELLGEPC